MAIPIQAQEVIDRQGGRIEYRPIGFWFPFKQRFEDGSVACFGVTFPRNLKATFTFQMLLGADPRQYVFSFDDRVVARDDAKVVVWVGEQSVTLEHPAGLAHGRYFPRTYGDIQRLEALLLARATAAQRYFEVETASGQRHRFQADRIDRLKAFLIKKCSER